MEKIYLEKFRKDLKEFHEMTEKFYNKEITVVEYKGFSGGFGSYAQRGGERSMLRLRLAGGEVDKEKLKFIANSIEKYKINKVHLTTCQTIQLHNLEKKTVCELVEAAWENGIITRGGGGDYPRNVMCSPLSGVSKEETFDVLPFVKEAGNYLLGFIGEVKLPRKLKVCFSNDNKNEVQVEAGIMKISVKLSDLRLVEASETKQIRKIQKRELKLNTKSVESKIDLRGLDGQEACYRVDKYLDEAYLSNLGEVTIVHGRGTGVLRTEVTKMLRKNPHVKSFRLGQYGEGGDGATIVELK